MQSSLELASFEPATLAAMRTILPDWLEPANPFDFWIGIDVKGPREAHEVGLTAVFADPNVDLVLCTLARARQCRLRGVRRAAQAAAPAATTSRWRSCIYGGEAEQRWTADLEGADVPVFKTTRAAARALALMVQATM